MNSRGCVWRVEHKCWKLESGGWNVEGGGCVLMLEVGEWRVEY